MVLLTRSVIILSCAAIFSTDAVELRLRAMSLAQSSNCPIYGFKGACVSTGVVEGAIESAMCDDASSVECNVFKVFLKPMSDMYSLYADPKPSACLGDFGAEEIASNDDLGNQGCASLPVTDGKYGAFGVTFPISPILQSTMVPLSMWKVVTDVVEVAFCSLLQLPTGTCSGFTFGAVINDGALHALIEFIPDPEQLTDTILSLLSVIVDAGVSEIAFGFSTEGVFLIPIQTYHNGKWESGNVNAQFYFSFTGGLDLDFLPEAVSDIVSIQGTFTRSVNFGDPSFLNKLFSPNSKQGAVDFVSGYSEAITLNGVLEIGLATLTAGLVDDMSFEVANIMAYLCGGKAASGELGLPTGFYFSATSALFTQMAEYLSSICEKYMGIITSIGGKCPSLQVSEAKMGLYITADKMGFSMETPSNLAAVQCDVSSIASSSPTIKCKFETSFFQILMEGAEFVIKQLTSLGDTAGKEIARVAVSSFNTVGKFSESVVGDAIGVANAAAAAAAAAATQAAAEEAARRLLDEQRRIADAANKAAKDTADAAKKTVGKVGKKTKKFFG